MSNRNYRELFERLAKCNLPAGVALAFDKPSVLGVAFDRVTVKRGKFVGGRYLLSEPSECRAALMLIVDQMRAEGWMFRFDDTMKGSRVESTLWDKARVLNGFIVEESEVARSEVGQDPDEVTALAECLVAALGVKE